jgi:hypothetical protein
MKKLIRRTLTVIGLAGAPKPAARPRLLGYVESMPLYDRK